MSTRTPTKETIADPSVRESLLQVAAQLFTRKGYASTSVREIVESAGVTKPTLYYYFDSKEGLYTTLVSQTFKEFDGLLEGLQAHEGDPWERLRELCLGVFDLSQNHRPEIRLIYAMYYGPPQGAPEFDLDAPYYTLLETIDGLVREALDAGRLAWAPVDDITLAVFSLVDTCMETALNHPERGLTRDDLSRLLNLLFKGIGGGVS